MQLGIEIERRPGYLYVTAHGEWDLASAKEHMGRVEAASEEAGLSRVLVDFRSMTPPSQEMDRFQAGLHAAQVWKPPMRVAGVWAAENITRFAENTAVNRGAVFRMFPNETEALAWLLEGDDTAGQQ